MLYLVHVKLKNYKVTTPNTLPINIECIYIQLYYHIYIYIFTWHPDIYIYIYFFFFFFCCLDLLPGIITQLGPDNLNDLKKIYASYQAGDNKTGGAKDDEDDVPDLVENFEEVANKAK